MSRRAVALTVAGTDSSGGAGVAADLRTFDAHGVWGACAVTAVTAQDTTGVRQWEPVPPALVVAQLAAVAGDLGVDAAKTGMLGSAAVVAAVASAVKARGISRLVVDPVTASGTGTALLDTDGVDALRRLLVPLATVVTPNLAEAARLVGFEVSDRASMVAAGRALVAMGAGAALVTGGHLDGPTSPDCLVAAHVDPVWLEGDRVDSPHTHGSGCVLSAAVCAGIALGLDPAEACTRAKRFTARAIAAGVALGKGAGPVDPGWERAAR